MLEYLTGVAGGLAIFLYGISTCSRGLQKSSDKAVKQMIRRYATHPLIAVVVGGLVTFLMQSSSATTVILVNLVGSSLLTLKQSIALILGADIGTTLTIQLIAFDITSLALGLVAVGYIIRLITPGKSHRFIGQIIFGFGFIFLGMGMIGNMLEPLREYPEVVAFFSRLDSSAGYGVVVAALFTGLIQGSAATVGLVLSLVSQDFLSLSGAIPLIIGANIGTCSTALLSIIGASGQAKRVAFSHVIIKLAGALVLLPLLDPFVTLITNTSAHPARQVANAHTLYNIGLGLGFLPLATKLSSLLERLIPEEEEAPLGRPQFLRSSGSQSSLVSLEQARAEILRVAAMIHIMVKNLGEIMKGQREPYLAENEEIEVAVDSLYQSIVKHLSDIGQQALSEQESRDNLIWLQVMNDLEHIGDIAIRLSRLIGHNRRKVDLTEMGSRELVAFQEKVEHLVSSMLEMLDNRNEQDIQALLNEARQVVDWEMGLRVSHIRRLQAHVTVAYKSDDSHLDVINGLKRIADHVILIGRNCASPQEDGAVDMDVEWLNDSSISRGQK